MGNVNRWTVLAIALMALCNAMAAMVLGVLP